MRFRMSPNVAIRTSQFSDTVDFYTKVISLDNRSEDPDLADLDASPLNIFIVEDDEFQGPVLELFVDDLEAARKKLVANGCKVTRWWGKGQDCYIEDPFRVIYNIWEG